MTALRALLEDLARAGTVLWLDSDRLRFRAPVGAVHPELRARAVAARAALIEAVRAGAITFLPAAVPEWSEDWLANFEERAAIMQFEGELTREVAERRAEACVRAEHARVHAAREGW